MTSVRKPTRYPFFQHAHDICTGVKDLFIQAGLWRVQGLVLPRQMRLPERSPAAINKTLLDAHWPDGVYVRDLPEGITLKLVQEKYTNRSAFLHLSGAPPNGQDSFFFDGEPRRSYFMQGRSHFLSSMSHGLRSSGLC